MSAPLWQQQRLLTRRALQSNSHPSPLGRTSVQCQHRTIFESIFGSRGNKKQSSPSKSQNPFLEDVLSRKVAKKTPKAPPQGDLSAGSVFSSEEDVKEPVKEEQRPDSPRSRRIAQETDMGGQKRNIQAFNAVVDPNPRQRELWQRKMVIKSMRKKERLTKDELVRKTEREMTVKSADFKTSVKKLGALARQIQGKSVEDALVQMQFSKKKAAKDIKGQLEYARDSAIVSRGMGLGGVVPEGEEGTGAIVPPAAVDIQMKDGKRRTVADLSKIYIDQAWVGRGPYGQEPDYRARGRTNIMRNPNTHITFKLKEESTLVREWQEREEKRRRQRLDKAWMPLPDRPIQGQQPWHCW